MDIKGRPWPKQCIFEWNVVKNGPMEKYYLKSHKKVWWICSTGKCPDGTPHEWESCIGSRTLKNNSTGCPICSNKQICNYDFCNSLKHLSSELLKKEWNKKKNGSMKKYLPHSNKKVWWICSKGKCPDGTYHEWETIIAIRTGRTKGGCVICSNHQICKYDYCNSLKYSSSELLKKEWNKKKNGSMKEYSPCSNKKVWWICSKNHKWFALLSNRTATNPKNCPKCNLSKLEKKMVKSCKILDIVLITEYKINECRNIYPLPFDGYVPSLNILIEMDGIQHFEHIKYFHRTVAAFKKQMTTDIIKSKFAWNNNFNFLRISHSVNMYDIEKIIKEFINLCSCHKIIHHFYVSKNIYIKKIDNKVLTVIDDEKKEINALNILEIYKTHFD